MLRHCSTHGDSVLAIGHLNRFEQHQTQNRRTRRFAGRTAPEGAREAGSPVSCSVGHLRMPGKGSSLCLHSRPPQRVATSTVHPLSHIKSVLSS